ncbi:MAG: ArsR/SmtB family transcription factor [Eisenbergiella sp.]
MENDFTLEKARFIENYNLARPIMTILGDEVRQEILLSLIESGGMGGIRVGDIQKKSHVSRSAVSHHLKVLLDAGIICMRREGTKNYYYIDFNASTVKPVILFWQQVEPMLKRCIEERERRS